MMDNEWHYCKDHQGNRAHYTKYNCMLCKAKMVLTNHRLRMEMDVRPDDRHMHEVNSLRSLHVAMKKLLMPEGEQDGQDG